MTYRLLFSARFPVAVLLTLLFVFPHGCAAQNAPRPFPFVGFWMSPTQSYRWDARMRTYEPMIASWKKAGANGILITDREKSDAVERAGYARGYRQRWYAGTDIRIVRRLATYLEDPAFREAYTGIYFDEILFTWSYDPGIPLVFEPFSVTALRTQLDSVLDLCERYRKPLGLAAYALNGRPQFDSLYQFVRSYDERHRDRKGRLTTSRLKNLFIFFSGAYFLGTRDAITQNLDSVAAWARRTGFPMKNLMLWQNPSCTFMQGGKLTTTPGCTSDWIEEQLLHAARLGFGGVYFYLGDSVSSEARDHILTGLWMTGNLKVRGKTRPSTLPAMKARLGAPTYRDRLLQDLRQANLPTYRGSWEWDK